MKFTFLGGADEIGSTAMLFETNEFSGIFEYGLTPSDPPQYPMDAPAVDYVFLSHAHLDHSGMIPWLSKRYPVEMYMSEMTAHLARILLRDNIKICEIEGYPTRYSKMDIQNMSDALTYTDFGASYNLKHCKLLVHSAGHIPGADMFELGLNDERTLLFTGDINTTDTRLVAGTRGKECDVLIMESTYAGRDHEMRQKIEYNFQEKIKEVIENGGKVIIPAFAVGRTQEILLVLADLGFEVWLDGMGKDVTKLFLRHPEFIVSEKKLRKIFESVNLIKTRAHRRKALDADIILSTSGMLDGGPVLRYIRSLNDNPKNAILLTGYQVEGTNGRLLLDEGKLRFNNEVEKIILEVEHFDFSAHAGHKEMIEFARSCTPEHIILFHGDNRELMKQELEEFAQVHLPRVGETLEL